jgi:hypothetical protein
LKEYDGNWNFIQLSDEVNEVLSDDWIVKNFDVIANIYADIHNKSFYNNLFEHLRLSDLTSYLDPSLKLAFVTSIPSAIIRL